jgi:hypothetical protein
MKKILPLLILLLVFSLPAGKAGLKFSVNPQVSAQEPSPTDAPDAITITASPPRLELEALPGATLQETLQITNASDTEQAFQAQFTDFIVTNDQGTPVAVEEAVSGRWSLASWLSLKPVRVLLQPQESASFDLVINIPDDALPGGHYAMVTYQPISEGLIGEPPAGSAIIQKVGTLIYLNVIGDITEAAYLKEFKVDDKFKYYGPTKIFAEIENLGDVHIQPIGTISVKNWFNQIIFSEALEPKNIFPFASRTYETSVPGKWRFGRYQAKLEATAGDSQVPINGLIYFWIVPVREVAMVAIIILAVIILIALKKKKKSPPAPEPEAAPITPETPSTTPPASS